MKNIVRATLALFSAIAIVLLPVASSAQIGYSITDNNRDTSQLDQQYYQFNLTTGQGTLIAHLTPNGLASGPGNPQIRREYEGLAGTGGVLFGLTEFDTESCNTGSDPITGLAADVRMFRANAAYPLANGVISAIGPQIGEMCIPSGFTEGAGAYSPIDGFLYYIASDDLLPASAPRSKLYRVSPTNGLATQIGAAAGITLAVPGGDENPYLDGLAITPDGRAFATEARFQENPGCVPGCGGLYRITLTGLPANIGKATFVKNLFSTDVNRDTGLANLGLTLYLLLEDGRVFTTDTSPGGAVLPASYGTLTTPGCLRPIAFPGQFCGDFEGFDIPNNGNGLR